MFSDIDCLAMAYPRQHLARVMPQVPETYRSRVRHHESKVLQICGYNYSYPITVPESAGRDDPLWQSSTAVVGERFMAKFAWSHPAALRLDREIGVLTALAREPAVPFLPELTASSTDPPLLITRFVPGASLSEVVESIDRDCSGGQLATFLATLHQTAARGPAVLCTGICTVTTRCGTRVNSGWWWTSRPPEALQRTRHRLLHVLRCGLVAAFCR